MYNPLNNLGVYEAVVAAGFMAGLNYVTTGRTNPLPQNIPTIEEVQNIGNKAFEGLGAMMEQIPSMSESVASSSVTQLFQGGEHGSAHLTESADSSNLGAHQSIFSSSGTLSSKPVLANMVTNNLLTNTELEVYTGNQTVLPHCLIEKTFSGEIQELVGQAAPMELINSNFAIAATVASMSSAVTSHQIGLLALPLGTAAVNNPTVSSAVVLYTAPQVIGSSGGNLVALGVGLLGVLAINAVMGELRRKSSEDMFSEIVKDIDLPKTGLLEERLAILRGNDQLRQQLKQRSEQMITRTRIPKKACKKSTTTESTDKKAQKKFRWVFFSGN